MARALPLIDTQNDFLAADTLELAGPQRAGDEGPDAFMTVLCRVYANIASTATLAIV